MYNSKTTCTFESFPSFSAIRGVYPTLTIETFPTKADMATSLMDLRGGCDAALMPRIEFDRLKSDPVNCNMRAVETVFPQTSGWLMSREHTCVAQAFEWALHLSLIHI